MKIDQRGGCCIARYVGGAYDISKMNRIMLRFRPIAPKPASANGSVSGGRSCSSASPERCSGASAKPGRGKRRQAGVGKSSRRKRRSSPDNTDSGGSVNGEEKMIKTLPLLPEAPDVKAEATSNGRFPLWLSFENGGKFGEVLHDPTAVGVGRRVVVASWVKVECVTDTWQVGWYPYGRMGRTDEERVRSLEGDTCPGFLSDGLNRVRWTNAAYRRMVAGGGEVAAWLVVEEEVELPIAAVAVVGFTCRVRVVTCGNEKASTTVLCDVWRMDCGGFGWRLDTAAALSLCIGN